jgi:glutathione peroxidase
MKEKYFKKERYNMIYDYKVKNIKGDEVSLNNYKGKVLLIVNTATGCGFTPQYEGLQKIYNKYKDKGLEILDFPCNQFFEQAPGSNEEIANFCQLKYNTTFETLAKIEVNGENTSDLYKFLKKEAPKAAEDEASEGLYKFLSEKGFNTTGDDIKWNFTKFLIDRTGTVVARYAPTYEPEKLEESIEKLL